MNEPDAPVLDETVLTELGNSVEGDDAFVRELIEAYIADGTGHLEAISASVGNADAAMLVRPAHTLKSSSATLGALRVATVARGLEMAGRTGSLDVDVAAADVAALRTEWDRAVSALHGWLAGERG